jgi:hypothetical protein
MQAIPRKDAPWAQDDEPAVLRKENGYGAGINIAYGAGAEAQICAWLCAAQAAECSRLAGGRKNDPSNNFYEIRDVRDPRPL